MIKKRQLFLLHFAGGNKYSFQFLKALFEPQFEFIPLELPGRGRRMKEALLKDKTMAVQDYLRQVEKKRNGEPFLIYGHSMGASLGLELTALLEKNGDAPLHLVVTGNAGPETGEKKEVHKMSKPEFKEELKRLGGVPEEVFQNEELLDFFLPILYADFELLEKAEYTEGLSLNVPITALMGDEEETVDEIVNWNNYSNNTVITKVLAGNHFFINDHSEVICQIIKNCYDTATIHRY